MPNSLSSDPNPAPAKGTAMCRTHCSGCARGIGLAAEQLPQSPWEPCSALMDMNEPLLRGLNMRLRTRGDYFQCVSSQSLRNRLHHTWATSRLAILPNACWLSGSPASGQVTRHPKKWRGVPGKARVPAPGDQGSDTMAPALAVGLCCPLVVQQPRQCLLSAMGPLGSTRPWPGCKGTPCSQGSSQALWMGSNRLGKSQL